MSTRAEGIAINSAALQIAVLALLAVAGVVLAFVYSLWVGASVVGALAILGGVYFLVAYRDRLGNLSESSAQFDESKQFAGWARSYGLSAWFLSGLSLLLTLIGSFTLYSNVWIGLFFCLAAVGALITTMIAFPSLLNAIKRLTRNPWGFGNWMMVLVLAALGLATTIFLAVTSIKAMLDDAAAQRDGRIANAQELAAQQRVVDAAWAEVERYSGYKKPDGIATEEARNREASDAAAAANRETATRRAELERQIRAALGEVPANSRGAPAGKTLEALTDGCTKTTSWYYRYCAEVSAARQALERLGGEAQAQTSTNYLTNHQSYNSKYAHWEQANARLEAMRQGDGVVSADTGFARALAQMSGDTPEHALWKYLVILGLFFDLAARLCLIARQYYFERAGNQYDADEYATALKTLGMDLKEVVEGALKGQPKIAAKVYQPYPAALSGAEVLEDGLIEVHAREGIVNPWGMEILRHEYGIDIHELNRQGLEMSRQGHDASAPVGTHTRAPAGTHVPAPAGTHGAPPPRVQDPIDRQCKLDKILNTLRIAADTEAYRERVLAMLDMPFNKNKSCPGSVAEARAIFKELNGQAPGCQTQDWRDIIRTLKEELI